MRAVRKVGSEDLEDVVEDYQSRTFGFASSNFFTELLAAIEVEKNADQYFGKVERDQAPSILRGPVDDYIDIESLSVSEARYGADPGAESRRFSDAAYSGKRLLPWVISSACRFRTEQSPDSAARVFLAGFEPDPRDVQVLGAKRPEALANGQANSMVSS